jgi:hypothetical protein
VLLFHFFVRRVLAATAAEFLEFQALRRRLPVLGGRIIALFAITALQRNNFSGHRSLPIAHVAADAFVRELLLMLHARG